MGQTFTENDVVFLFGAGAETCFGLPSGAEYTLRTMQQKHDSLYSALREFYANPLSDEKVKKYVKEYRDSFLFKSDSHTFREIIHRAAKNFYKENGLPDSSEVYNSIFNLPYKDYISCVYKFDGEQKTIGDREKNKYADELTVKEKPIYKLLIKGEVGAEQEKAQVQELSVKETPKFTDYISFYGAVEKDFSAIISPNETGLRQFWRLVNYYWSAFFTILEPLLPEADRPNRKSTQRKQAYGRLLENLNDIIAQIYKEYDYSKMDNASGNYYKAISDAFPRCTALTTNYTPFMEKYFKENVYLAGKLSQFEYPMELSVYDVLLDKKIERNDFVFPFLMTQAPIKPIIVPEQIEAYAKAITALDKAKTLVIIGYSLGAADNHINAMLHRFAKTKSKRIIYCYYVDKTKPNASDKEAEEKRKVIEALKCENCSAEIKMVRNEGNAKKLTAKIKEDLQYGSN